MNEVGIATLILIIANIFCSLQGLSDRYSFEQNNFQVEKILLNKDYKRLLTSGFFQVSALHLILNMASLCFFSGGLELQLGEARYLLIYFAGMIGGNLFSLFIHRHQFYYNTAVGASGAVSGVIFGTIGLFPHFEIGFLGAHFPIPGWFYGFLYVLVSIYFIKSKTDNIGHETQLAGGLAGLTAALCLQPTAMLNHYLTILAVTIPTVFFIFLLATHPRFLLIDNRILNRQRKEYNLEQLFLSGVVDDREVDLILEKIHLNGIESLTKLERQKLDHYSRIIQ